MQAAQQSSDMVTAKGSPRASLMNFINSQSYPCIAARSAAKNQNISIYEASHLACPFDDKLILQFLYDFVDNYRNNQDLFTSAAIVFRGPETISENEFENLFWSRLQALHNLDRRPYNYDQRVDSDPSSGNFSFSLKEEAFFIIGLYPGSLRPARNFSYPAIVFNPHQQFERLRQEKRFE